MNQNENQFSPSEDLINEYLQFLEYSDELVKSMDYRIWGGVICVTMTCPYDEEVVEVQLNNLELLGFINRKLNKIIGVKE